MPYSFPRAVAVSFVLLACGSQAEEPPAQITSPDDTVEMTPLPQSIQIKALPLEVDIELATRFVQLGFGYQELGKVGFQSTHYGPERFAGRVSSAEFGRELSPVLYVDLPYWTHQREGPVSNERGQRISEEDNARLVEELRAVFVNRLHAEEFSLVQSNERTVRIWWHH